MHINAILTRIYASFESSLGLGAVEYKERKIWFTVSLTSLFKLHHLRFNWKKEHLQWCIQRDTTYMLILSSLSSQISSSAYILQEQSNKVLKGINFNIYPLTDILFKSISSCENLAFCLSSKWSVKESKFKSPVILYLIR